MILINLKITLTHQFYKLNSHYLIMKIKLKKDVTTDFFECNIGYFKYK